MYLTFFLVKKFPLSFNYIKHDYTTVYERAKQLISRNQHEFVTRQSIYQI